MTTAREAPIVLEGLERLYRADEHQDLLELLILALHKQLYLLERYGLYRDYIRQEKSLTMIRGKVLLKQTLQRHWTRLQYNQATCAYFDFSRDVAINQAIRYTLWFVLRTYPTVARQPDQKIMVDLDRASRPFAYVTLDRSRKFLPVIYSILKKKSLPQSRIYLSQLLWICHVILADLGVDIEDTEDTAIVLPPMVINMELVFQRFIFESSKEALSNRREVSCLDTTRENKEYLFRSPETPPLTDIPLLTMDEKAEPDMLLMVDNEPKAVCDVKYTIARERAHVYQIVSHALAYGVQDGVLIYPAVNEGEDCRCVCLGKVGDVRIFEFRFPLDAVDLSQTSIRFAETLMQIVDQPRPESPIDTFL